MIGMAMRTPVNTSSEVTPTLFDRAAFFSLLNPERGALRHTSDESLLLFATLDNLAQIVSDCGIDAGRTALADTARTLALSFRLTDPVAQLSTNLFAVLAISAGRQLAHLLLERMKTSFEIANMERTEEPALVIRSGFTFYDPADPTSPEELFSEARATLSP